MSAITDNLTKLKNIILEKNELEEELGKNVKEEETLEYEEKPKVYDREKELKRDDLNFSLMKNTRRFGFLFDGWKNNLMEFYFGKEKIPPFSEDTNTRVYIRYEDNIKQLEDFINKSLPKAVEGIGHITYTQKGYSQMDLSVKIDNTPYEIVFDLRPGNYMDRGNPEYKYVVKDEDLSIVGDKEATREYLNKITTTMKNFLNKIDNSLKQKILLAIQSGEINRESKHNINEMKYQNLMKDVIGLNNRGRAEDIKMQLDDFYLTFNDNVHFEQVDTKKIQKKSTDELLEIYHKNNTETLNLEFLREMQKQIKEEKFNCQYQTFQEKFNKEVVPIISDTIEMIQEYFNTINPISTRAATCDHQIMNFMDVSPKDNSFYLTDYYDGKRFIVKDKMNLYSPDNNYCDLFPLGITVDIKNGWDNKIDIYMPNFEDWKLSATNEKEIKETFSELFSVNLDNLDKDIDKMITDLKSYASAQKDKVIENINEQIRDELNSTADYVQELKDEKEEQIERD